MKALRYAGIIFFNFICGCLFVLVIAPWVMSYVYVAEAFGWIIDPTLDEGLLIVFLLMAIAISIIYFPILILRNIYLNKKLEVEKKYLRIFVAVVFIAGFFSAGLILYLN